MTLVGTPVYDEVLKRLEAKLGICPKCQSRQVLAEVMIRKKNLGGKFEKGNLTNLCLPCDEDWREFCATQGLTKKSSFADFKVAFVRFLKAEKPKLSGRDQALAILREVAGLRIAVAIEAQRIEGRFRSRARRLDDVYPFGKSYTGQLLAKRGDGENEVLPKDWLKYLMSQVAEVGGTKRALEREIEKQLRYFPVWELFAEKVPGIGPYLAGYLIAMIRDPKRFPDSSHLSGNVGLRVFEDENGRMTAQRRERGGKLNYDPVAKLVVVRLIPQSLDYQRSRFPDSPYSVLLENVKAVERKKAENETPSHCWVTGCNETDVVNLGYGERETGERYFKGFCCRKTLGTSKVHHFLHPAHVMTRVYRKVGRLFLLDFYHIWLYLEGENPNIACNPRIMYFLQSAANGVADSKE
ncbi:MAG: transposase [Patescibacteria group bacterium]